MTRLLEPNKTKMAKRVIEVFEFFEGHRRGVTVMDIVRRYGRPQSSTSELLASLVEMGLLYKDARSYLPTPRLATLGTSAQPEMIRDGRLFGFMDRLAYSTRCGVALFGMVGTHAQIFRWSAGGDLTGSELGCGASEPLSQTFAGLLLLSTINAELAGRILCRINAEAPSGRKFNPAALAERIAVLRREHHGTGEGGFLPDTRVTATLLPLGETERPLALGLVYPADAVIHEDALLRTMERGIAQCAAPEDDLLPGASPAPMRIAI